MLIAKNICCVSFSFYVLLFFEMKVGHTCRIDGLFSDLIDIVMYVCNQI